MLGSLHLPLYRGRHFKVFGGPYLLRPPHMVGVKMAKELPAPADIVIPTEDFSVPTVEELDAGLRLAIDAIVHGEPVYVGCMGGRGRTGLFLSLLAKAFGVSAPVEYVREHYYPHAVETKQQYSFVMSYKIPADVEKKIKRAKLGSLLRFRKLLTKEFA